MWAPMTPPSPAVAPSAARPTAGSPVVNSAAAEAALPAAMAMLAAFLPGSASALLPSRPCSLPNATALPGQRISLFQPVNQQLKNLNRQLEAT